MSDQSEKAKAFLADIEVVCRKHGLSIAHEDGHGAFIVEPFSEDTMRWLREAFDQLGELGTK